MSLLSEEQKEWDALVESLVQEWQAVWLDLAEQILAAEGSELT
jgi:hypothetical protein